MENQGITVTQALNQIQSWLNAGDFEKTIKGCQEILQVEPGNQRALALMKQAEEKRHEGQAAPAAAPAATPEPATTTPAPEAAPAPKPDPLEQLQVEEPSAPAAPTETKTAETPAPTPAPGPALGEKKEKRNLFLAMLIPAILVVIIGGGIIWYLSNNQREEVIEDAITVTDEDTTYLEENEERVEALTEMGQIIEDFKDENGAYPSVSQIDSVLLSGGLDELPTDPRHEEFDKSGKVFGYMYAVYETSEGENMEYILSGLFEDSKGFGYAWTRGGSTKDHEDYRDYNEDYVSFIGGEEEEEIVEEEEEEEEPSGPKVKVKR